MEKIKESYVNYYDLPKEIRRDKNFILEAVKINYLILTIIDIPIDNDIIHAAVYNNEKALLYYRGNDLTFYEKCMKQNPKSIIFCPKILQNNFQYCSGALKSDQNIYHLLPLKIRNKRNLYVKYEKNKIWDSFQKNSDYKCKNYSKIISFGNILKLL